MKRKNESGGKKVYKMSPAQRESAAKRKQKQRRFEWQCHLKRQKGIKLTPYERSRANRYSFSQEDNLRRMRELQSTRVLLRQQNKSSANEDSNQDVEQGVQTTSVNSEDVKGSLCAIQEKTDGNIITVCHGTQSDKKISGLHDKKSSPSPTNDGLKNDHNYDSDEEDIFSTVGDASSDDDSDVALWKGDSYVKQVNLQKRASLQNRPA